MAITRRRFLAAASAAAAGPAVGLATAGAQDVAKKTGIPTPYIHVTDLYHPHMDPDDHWDLLTVYALAAMGRLDLRGVVVDHPLNAYSGDPAIAAVAQLNHLTGLSVPVAVGSPLPYAAPEGTRAAAPRSDRSAQALIHRILRDSAEPVAIAAIGACRDVALAAREEPELFAAKCRRVAICAGTGSTRPEDWANRDYNVQLDPPAYGAIFSMACPVYWFPVQETHVNYALRVETYGTYWWFQHKEVLGRLAAEVQSYLLYAMTRQADQKWLDYLRRGPDPVALEQIGELHRNMWCTALFLHLAGLHALTDGALVPLDQQDPQQTMYTLEPIRIEADDAGVRHWVADPDSTDRFIFRLDRKDVYRDAMVRALGEVLAVLAP